MVADLTDPAALARALEGATHVVSCAHARYTARVIAAAPEAARLVLLGSTRKFTRWPDAHGNGVLAGEAALLASGRSGVMLHPTMIYGAQGEDNVRRLAALMRRLPVLPLPAGGRSLVQPIHQSDVTPGDPGGAGARLERAASPGDRRAGGGVVSAISSARWRRRRARRGRGRSRCRRGR